MKLSYSLSFLFLFFVFLFAAPVDAAAKDEWVQVRSKNFFLIGNASEKEIRQVGTRLEQFRETFRQLFRTANLTGSRPTNVVVFKNASAYKPFKPKRSDGKADTEIAGYFQPGEDVNYITLSAGGDDKDTFGTIFHEYVHFIIETNFGKSEVPQWFNEGLAEYYQTFEMSGDQKARLGLPQNGHLALLQQSKLMPLDMLFNTSNQQLHQTGGHSRSIFYAQSWALVHYIVQNGKSPALDNYLKLVTGGTAAKKAFQDAFQTTYEKMESDLRKYISQNTYKYSEVTFKNKLTYDSEMTAAPLDDAASNAYLGDLLYHANRADDAEPYLLAALKLQPDSSMANTALGMVKVRQGKFNEARGFLETAIASDPRNHIAFYQYAFLLSRDGRDEFGYINRFEPATAAKMREALKKAISLKPEFTESHELFAFVALVNNEELDEAATQLNAALKLQPGNQRYALRLAEIYSRQNKLAEAAASAEKIARTTDDPEVKNRAENLLNTIRQMKEIEERNAAQKNLLFNAAVIGPPKMVKRIDNVPEPSAAELAKLREAASLRSINEALRVPLDGEQRLIGRFEKIVCKGGSIVYHVKTPTETLTLASKDFAALTLTSLDAAATNAEVGCDANLASFNAVITYKAAAASKPGPRGELIAVDFVPANFRMMTGEEMGDESVVIYDEPQQTISTPDGKMPSAADFDSQRRAFMLQSMKDALRKPVEGETRELGFLEKIECTKKGNFFHIRTSSKTLRLSNPSIETLSIKVFAADLGGVQFRCGIKPVEFPAVFIYKAKPDAKVKTDGEIVSIEFMPISFVLE